MPENTRQQFEDMNYDVSSVHLWPAMFNIIDGRRDSDIEPFAGYTRFYRYPDLTRALKRRAERHEAAKPLSVIFLGCSIGCDAYSFALEAFRGDLFAGGKLADIEALDASALFTRIAREGTYPVEAMQQVPGHAAMFFECTERYDAIQLWPEIREHMRVHEAQTLQAWTPAAAYDIAVCDQRAQLHP
jgi:chemotaxis methyl-accepting protein methylase